MKKYTVAAMALLFSASLASAGQAPKTVTAAIVKAPTHVVAAEVVKGDVAAKTITIKDAKGGADITMPCEGKAVTALKTVKAGEKVDLTCRDNDKGEHQAITNIKASKPPVAPKVAKK